MAYTDLYGAVTYGNVFGTQGDGGWGVTSSAGYLQASGLQTILGGKHSFLLCMRERQSDIGDWFWFLYNVNGGNRVEIYMQNAVLTVKVNSGYYSIKLYGDDIGSTPLADGVWHDFSILVALDPALIEVTIDGGSAYTLADDLVDGTGWTVSAFPTLMATDSRLLYSLSTGLREFNHYRLLVDPSPIPSLIQRQNYLDAITGWDCGLNAALSGLLPAVHQKCSPFLGIPMPLAAVSGQQSESHAFGMPTAGLLAEGGVAVTWPTDVAPVPSATFANKDLELINIGEPVPSLNDTDEWEGIYGWTPGGMPIMWPEPAGGFLPWVWGIW